MIARRGERGQALLLAVLALGVGMLVITPFLANASETLLGSGIYARDIHDRYAGDAGIEYGIWGLLNGTWTVTGSGTLDLPVFALNGRDVAVTITDLGSGAYDVRSRVADGTGHLATVASVFRLGGWTSDGDLTGDVSGDVFVSGDASVGGGVTVDGSLYATGNITMDTNAEVTGDVATGGDLNVSNNGVIGGDVSANGTVTLSNNTSVGSLEIGGDVCAAGDVVLLNNVTVYGDVFVGGDLAMYGNAAIAGNVFTGAATARIVLDNNALIGGSVYLDGSLSDRLQLANNAAINGAVYAAGTIAHVVRPQNVAGGIYENYTGGFPPGPT
jgi:predicted acyltransferase (DUF342 family)